MDEEGPAGLQRGLFHAHTPPAEHKAPRGVLLPQGNRPGGFRMNINEHSV